MKAPQPNNESERLNALAAYHVMDSEPEQVFDDLTTLAAQICNCPIALVTLVDDSRQWFKSRVGLEGAQTPREHAFCAHALLDPMQLLVVPDARLDERFADNPLVTGSPHIRFYAGAPLMTPQGFPLGTICVIDRTPREFPPDQQKALLALGRLVSQSLEFRRVSRTLAVALDNMRTLEGLLPICANCKSIRDEDNLWSSVEAYVVKHTPVNFTHGICPDCAVKLYPDLDFTEILAAQAAAVRQKAEHPQPGA